MLRIIDEKSYLNNLLETYGNITLQQLLLKLQYRPITSIEKCRFGGVFTFNHNSDKTPGELNEFTGTIKELLQKILLPQYNSENIKLNLFEIAAIFADCGKISYYGEKSDINIILNPIDREVSWDEVRNYLISLSAELSESEKA